MTMLSDEELAKALAEVRLDLAQYATLDDLERIEGHINALRRGGATLGKIVEDQCRDALAAIGNPSDLIGEDGDGDWAAVWERLAELRPERDAAIRERDRARDIAVSLDQELAEVQVTPQRWLIGSGSTEGASDTTKVTAWNATPAVYPVEDKS